MGCANNWLIPPAILFNNPGITREEFVELLNETRTGYGKLEFHNPEAWKKAPWNFIGDEDTDCHKGLHGLAGILGLNFGEDFKKIKWKDDEEYELSLICPSLDITPFLINGKWEISYKVDTSVDELQTNVFYSLPLLLEKYPYFDPDFMYDWNKSGDIFWAPPEMWSHNRKKGLRWKQENGRYYLDIENLPGISQEISPTESQSGYTDLIVSAEALRLKAWKMFAFHGYERDRTEIFLETFPDAARAHALAVWNAYTFEHARKKGMTTNEILRFRILPPNAE